MLLIKKVQSDLVAAVQKLVTWQIRNFLIPDNFIKLMSSILAEFHVIDIGRGVCLSLLCISQVCTGREFKNFFKLNSAEQYISNAHEYKY